MINETRASPREEATKTRAGLALVAPADVAAQAAPADAPPTLAEDAPTPLAAASEADRRLWAMCAPAARACGLRLVRARVWRGPGAAAQVMVEGADGDAAGLDACAALSRALSARAEDALAPMFSTRWRLEVSSPGLARPLTRREDFQRWRGAQVEAELHDPLPDGRRRLRGVSLGAGAEDMVGIAIGDGADDEAWFPFAALARARLAPQFPEQRPRKAKPARRATR